MSKITVVLVVIGISISQVNATANNDQLPPKIQQQLNQVLTAYQNGLPRMFNKVAIELIKQTNSDQLEQIDKILSKRKYPSLNDMIGEMRVRSLMANVELPKLTWIEFMAVLPFLDQQAADLKQEFETSEFFAEAIPPKGLKAFEDKFWELHVFRNRFNAMAKASEELKKSSKFFKRQIEGLTNSRNGTHLAAVAKLPDMARQLYELRNRVDEREAELRVHRTTEAESLLDVGQKFETRLNAAFALADDRLFFKNYFDKIKEENRVLVNQDLQDDSILKMVSDTSEAARKRYPALFDKATLLYAGSHWWLRGRYGQGPLANGLLKSVHAGNSEKELFPLLMPTKFPSPEELAGNKPPFRPVRRHHYVWVLGVDRFHASGPTMSGGQAIQKESNTVVQERKGEPFRAKVTFNRFY